MIEDGQILPQHNLRLSQQAPHLSTCDKPLRIGVFPTAADPFHWMHLLSGLKVMALFKLDKVIYLITGGDSRKPGLLRADIRHKMGQHMLRIFSPLFAYSPIAQDNALDGEANIFRILQLNPRQKVDSFYIAGTDHYYRYNPETGKPDIGNTLAGRGTLEKLAALPYSVFAYIRKLSLYSFFSRNLNSALQISGA